MASGIFDELYSLIYFVSTLLSNINKHFSFQASLIGFGHGVTLVSWIEFNRLPSL